MRSSGEPGYSGITTRLMNEHSALVTVDRGGTCA
jgi:hypothetical protein